MDAWEIIGRYARERDISFRQLSEELGFVPHYLSSARRGQFFISREAAAKLIGLLERASLLSSASQKQEFLWALMYGAPALEPTG